MSGRCLNSNVLTIRACPSDVFRNIPDNCENPEALHACGRDSLFFALVCSLLPRARVNECTRTCSRCGCLCLLFKPIVAMWSLRTLICCNECTCTCSRCGCVCLLFNVPMSMWMSGRCLDSNALTIWACPSDALLNIPDNCARDGPRLQCEHWNCF